ncbi:MAG: Mobile element protein [Labilithrix sp.]|nr:Mobile element protein [Labilithrix sp.]
MRIVAGRFEPLHRRRKKGDLPAPLPEHRATKVAAVHGKRAKLYEKRQQVLDLGADALALLTEITHREPKLAGRRVEDLYALLERHGDEAMRAAIARAVRSGELTVAAVERALSTPSARRAQPRGHDGRQLALPSSRAESKGGPS